MLYVFCFSFAFLLISLVVSCAFFAQYCSGRFSIAPSTLPIAVSISSSCLRCWLISISRSSSLSLISPAAVPCAVLMLLMSVAMLLMSYCCLLTVRSVPATVCSIALILSLRVSMLCFSLCCSRSRYAVSALLAADCVSRCSYRLSSCSVMMMAAVMAAVMYAVALCMAVV